MTDRAAFERLAETCGIVPPEASAIYGALAARYGEGHRVYHTLAHLDAMRSDFARCGGRSEAIEWAIWMHDVIYDPESGSNEADSAHWFEERLRDRLPPERVADITRLIRSTDHRTPRSDRSDEQLLADLDLAILSASADEYLDYAAAIRQEYRHVPDGVFRKGRCAVLERFLEGPIYQTRHFSGREARARQNLNAEIRQLHSD